MHKLRNLTAIVINTEKHKTKFSRKEFLLYFHIFLMILCKMLFLPTDRLVLVRIGGPQIFSENLFLTFTPKYWPYTRIWWNYMKYTESQWPPASVRPPDYKTSLKISYHKSSKISFT